VACFDSAGGLTQPVPEAFQDSCSSMAAASLNTAPGSGAPSKTDGWALRIRNLCQRFTQAGADSHDYFSRRTPLNFLAAVFFPAGFLTAMNSPPFLLRLVQAVTPPSAVLSWVRFFTAPLRALSPTGLFTAIVASIAIAGLTSKTGSRVNGSRRRNESGGRRF
jgi:hypothetical protein